MGSPDPTHTHNRSRLCNGFVQSKAPPWSVEELDACFVVKDSNGQSWAMFISRKSPGGDQRRSCSARMRREGSLLIWINSLIGNWAYHIMRWPKITNCHQYNSATRMQRLKGCAYARSEWS